MREPEAPRQIVDGVGQGRTCLAPPFEVHVVIQEIALLNEFEGGPHIMRDQIRRLRELAERPNVTVQIVPLRRVVHPGSSGAFTILTYDGGGATVYNELMVSSLMSNDPDEVAAHQAAAKALTEEVALSVEDSMRLLDKLLG